MANKREKSGESSVKTAESINNKSSSKDSFRRVSKTAALIIAILICGGIALFTTIIVVAHLNSIRASQAEYDQLREIAGDIEAEPGVDGTGTTHLGALDVEMLQINPDYVGWIRIEGTDIDYPVVRGDDNEKYLHTSFYGEENITGAVFMDYRNVGDLTTHKIGDSLPHIIIYGHNLQQGGMFSDLRRLLNKQFFEEHRIITLIVNDKEIEFEIFSARRTDINDPAYNLNLDNPRLFARFADRIDAPLTATQIITLSTCIRGGSDDSRIVVQGYRLLD